MDRTLRRSGVEAAENKPGTPGGTRTPNLLVRSQTLYPIELRAHSLFPGAQLYQFGSILSMAVSGWFAVWMSILLAAANPVSGERLAAEDLYARAARSYQEERYPDAVRDFSEFISRYEREPTVTGVMHEIQYMLGSAQGILGNNTEAIELLEEFIPEEPKGMRQADALFRLACACQANRLLERVDKLTDRLIREYPSFPRIDAVYYQKANMCLALERYSDALPVLRHLKESARDETIRESACGNLVRCLVVLAEYRAGLEELKQLHREGYIPEQQDMLNAIALQLGDVLYADAEYDAALDSYRCIRRRCGSEDQESLKAFNSQWLLRMGRCLYDMNLLWEACIVFREAEEMFRGSGTGETAHEQLIYCLAQMQLYDKTIQETERFLRMYPGSDSGPVLVFTKAEAYFNQEQFEAAEREIRTLLQEYPGMKGKDRVELYLYIAQAMRERFDEAGRGLEQWLDTAAYINSPVRDSAAYWQGMILFYKEDYTNAVQRLREFVSAYPRSEYRAEAEYRLGVIHYMEGRYRDAALTLIAFIQAYPDHPVLPEAKVLRGDALAAMGELNTAVSSYADVAPEDGPYYHYAIEQIGKCYRAIGAYTNMITVYETYIEQAGETPAVVEGIYWLGWAYRQCDDLPSARKAYWMALRRFGNRQNWWGFSAIVQDLTGLYAGSNDTVRLGIQLREEKGSARDRGELTLASRLAMAQYVYWQFRSCAGEARAICEDFMREYPTNCLGPDGLMFRAARAGELRDREQELACYTLIADGFGRSPFCAEAQLKLSQAARENGDTKTARMLLDKAETGATEAGLVLEISMERGRMLLEDGRYSGAITCFERVLENRAARGPLWPEALAGTATAYQALQEFSKAIPYYQRVYVMYGGYTNLAAQAYYNSGLCFEKLQDYSAALRTYRELIDSKMMSGMPETVLARQRYEKLSTPDNGSIVHN